MGEEGASCAEGASGAGVVPAGGLWFRGAEKMMPEWEDAEESGFGSWLPGFLGWARGGGGGGSL